MRWISWIVALEAILAVTGCAEMKLKGLAKQSSGYVGCEPERIAISNVDDNSAVSTWTAACNGRRFACTRTMAPAGVAFGFTLQTQCSPISDSGRATAAGGATGAQ